MKRIYHHHDSWEDHKHKMYDNILDKKKQNMLIEKTINFFENEKMVSFFMGRIINEWKCCCEHNFTNPSMNKVAWLGQSASCLYSGANKEITIEAWNQLSEKTQKRANKIAEKTIKRWMKCRKDI